MPLLLPLSLSWSSPASRLFRFSFTMQICACDNSTPTLSLTHPHNMFYTHAHTHPLTQLNTHTHTWRALLLRRRFTHGVATISRLLKIIGLFCKRDYNIFTHHPIDLSFLILKQRPPHKVGAPCTHPQTNNQRQSTTNNNKKKINIAHNTIHQEMRENPKLLKADAKVKIAKESGRTVTEINKILGRYDVRVCVCVCACACVCARGGAW